MKIYKCPECEHVLDTDAEKRPAEDKALYCLDCENMVTPELVVVWSPVKVEMAMKITRYSFIILSFLSGLFIGLGAVLILQ